MSGLIDMYSTERTSPASRYLRNFWQPVATAGLAPGTAKPLHILGEKFTLYCGEAGAFHLTDFHCAHRRAQLSVGWVEGDNIRCRYHGWLYDADGQCIEQPAEGDNSFCGRIKLRSHPVVEYRGLLYAYLGEGTPPPFVTYPQLDGEGIYDNISYSRNCSYLNNLENNLDSVHINFVHHFKHHFEPMVVDVRETPFGATSLSIMPPEDFVRVAHFIMPNVLLVRLPMEDVVPGGRFKEGYAEVALWRVPRDDEHHENFGITKVVLPPDREAEYLDLMASRRTSAPSIGDITARVLAGETSLEDAEDALAPEHAGFKPFIEDCVIQEGQGRTRPDLEHLGRTDIGTALIRKLWQRELKSMLDGKPLTRFPMPGPLCADDISDAAFESVLGQ